jgi:chemotaxis protein CheD
VLLPSRALSRDASNRAKYPETAVPMMLDEMRQLGSRGRVVAKIAGGASMFTALLPGAGHNIGERNVTATCAALAQAGIEMVAQDTGGDFGRSVYFHLRGGRLVVRSIVRGEIAL